MSKKYITAGVIGIVAIIGVIFVINQGNTPGKYDDFAKCLDEKGAVFYGAFWCPHCQNQKAMFGRSAKYLPYVECSTPDGKGQLPVCTEKNIEGYPEWRFADGSTQSGEVSLEALAENTSCVLPGYENEPTETENENEEVTPTT